MFEKYFSIIELLSYGVKRKQSNNNDNCKDNENNEKHDKKEDNHQRNDNNNDENRRKGSNSMTKSDEIGDEAQTFSRK